MIDRRLPRPGEPRRDPFLARAIRIAEGQPASGARLELLRARIAAAAVIMIEGRRERAWWEWMTQWAHTEVAIAAAATVLAAAVGSATTVARGDVVSDTVAVTTALTRQPPTMSRVDSVVTGALAAGASSEQVMNALVGPASREWLLTATVVR